MSSLAWIALAAAAVVPAAPIEPGKWFTSQDHPKTALRVAQRGHVSYRIDISPEGRAIRCETPQAGDLDAEVCELVMRSARFTPATDERGQPVAGTYDGIASFLMPGNRTPRPDGAKLAVVDSLPQGLASPAYARVAFMVDAAGAIGHCASMAPERRRFRQTVAALGPAACDYLAGQNRPMAARDATGLAVPSAQSALVRFELRQPPG